MQLPLYYVSPFVEGPARAMGTCQVDTQLSHLTLSHWSWQLQPKPMFTTQLRLHREGMHICDAADGIHIVHVSLRVVGSTQRADTVTVNSKSKVKKTKCS